MPTDLEILIAEGQRAKLTGPEMAAFLATAWVESKWKRNAVGDGGTSFGYFQHHIGGAGGATKAQADDYLNPVKSARERARWFARQDIDTGREAAALQRPYDPAGYAVKVDAARTNILAGKFPDGRPAPAGKNGVPAAKPKWSPLRDEIRRIATGKFGLRQSSGDRTPAANSAAGGASGSDHLSTKTDTWADDYSGPLDKMIAFERYLKTRGDLKQVLGPLSRPSDHSDHVHVAGYASSGGLINTAALGGVLQGLKLGGAAGGAVDGVKDGIAWIAENVIMAGILFAGLLIGGALIFEGSRRLVMPAGSSSSSGDALKLAAAAIPQAKALKAVT